MNNRLTDSVRFASLALLGLALGCTQTDSLGNGGRQDAADGPPQTPGTGGATGSGGQGVGGSTGGGGIAGRSGSGGASGLGGGGVGGSTGSGGIAGGSGAGGTAGGQGGATGGPDALAPDAGAGTDGVGCSGPNPAHVTCVASRNQCVPSICNCSSAGTWVCTADCPVNSLPLCDAGAAPDGKASDVDAPDARGGFDCSGPNPAQVTCLTSWNQCVPSACSCSPEGGWMCTADCRGTSLPLCDGGVGPDAKKDAAGPDAAPDVVAAEAPAAANYTCRDDSDCCTVVDTCMGVAYLYSKAPGATGQPSIPPSTMCVPCIPPAVQVRCDQGQCVGEKIETGFDYNSPIRKSHCGTVAPPDAGAASMYQPAYMAAQQTSWGC